MISLDTNNKITMEGSTVVTMDSIIEICGTGVSMKVTHTADFKDIPTKYHQIYLDAFKASKTI